ncbi:hypothetical protein ACKP2L_05230 [Oenococcus alcoholitolerans]|uniref:hypothetical protein n=1 Tax=Oenococcus alcoholitolerans TaxID=931074 RepID=UPI003F71F2B3
MMIEQQTRISKTGKLMATTLSQSGKIVYKPMIELHSEALAINKAIEEQAKKDKEIQAENEIAQNVIRDKTRLQYIFDENDVISAKDAKFFQEQLILDREKWQERAVKKAVPSKTEFKIYRIADELYDGVASWSASKSWCQANCKGGFIDYIEDSTIVMDYTYTKHIFEKTIHVGDMVTFIGNQNGYEQFEVIA